MATIQFEQSERNSENEQSSSPVFEENQKKFSSTGLQQSNGRRNPPARNTSRFWFERFLAVIQRQNPSIIDSSFLSQIAPSNEGKLLAQLKFLGVIDEQGKPTRILPMLNMVGDAQKKAFQEISREAYRDLESEVKMDKAVADDVINFFIRKYAFTRDKAVNAAKFYLYLVEKSGSPVSSELASFLADKSTPNVQPNSPAPSPIRGSGSLAGKSQIRDSRTASSSVQGRQSSGRRFRAMAAGDDDTRSSIQAVINIRLEKDTPKEYWDRILALLGERQISEPPGESGNRANESANQGLDSDLTADSAFT